MGFITISPSCRLRRPIIGRRNEIGLSTFAVITPDVLKAEAERANAFIVPLSVQWTALATKEPEQFAMFMAWFKAWQGLYAKVQDFKWYTFGAGAVFNQVESYGEQANKWAEMYTAATGRKLGNWNPSDRGMDIVGSLKWLAYLGLAILAILILPPIVRAIVR